MDFIGKRSSAEDLLEALPVGVIEKIELFGGSGSGITPRYRIGDIPDLYILASISRQAYFSHATAMALQGITDTLSNNIYLTTEQLDNEKPFPGELFQEVVDDIFARPARLTKNRYSWKSYHAYMIRKKVPKFSIGVSQAPGTDYLCTDLERTMLDIVVRPDYAGGPKEVLAAFATINGRLDCSRLRTLLNTFEFTYPYHQSIGFYLERAGYTAAEWKQFKRGPQTINFYLANEMTEKVYDSNWHIFYPKNTPDHKRD